MLGGGSKIKHVKSQNFISEMADSFNVAGLQMGGGAKISLIVGRDVLSVREETLVADGAGFKSAVLQDDMIIERLVVANLSIPLDAAKALVAALSTGIAQIEQSIALAGGQSMSINPSASPTKHG